MKRSKFYNLTRAQLDTVTVEADEVDVACLKERTEIGMKTYFVKNFWFCRALRGLLSVNINLFSSFGKFPFRSVLKLQTLRLALYITTKFWMAKSLLTINHTFLYLSYDLDGREQRHTQNNALQEKYMV